MKMRSVTKILTAGAIALGATAIIQQPSSAQTNGFVCDTFSGIPTIYVDGQPIMTFKSTYFSGSGYTPQQRCKDVASRFNTFAPTGKLQFLTAGKMRGLPVICFVSTYGRPCASETVLLTLTPGDDAALILQQLFNLGNGSVASVDIVEQSENEDEDEDGSVYINFDRLLSSLSVERTETPSSPPVISSPTGQQVPPTRPRW